MTVYVVHNLSVKVDISSAYTYGEVKFVNHRYIYADELVNNRAPKGFDENIRKACEMFNPDKDYLLIAGDHLQLVIMVSALTEMHGTFNVLRYEREAAGYLPINIGCKHDYEYDEHTETN